MGRGGQGYAMYRLYVVQFIGIETMFGVYVHTYIYTQCKVCRYCAILMSRSQYKDIHNDARC